MCTAIFQMSMGCVPISEKAGTEGLHSISDRERQYAEKTDSDCKEVEQFLCTILHNIYSTQYANSTKKPATAASAGINTSAAASNSAGISCFSN